MRVPFAPLFLAASLSIGAADLVVIVQGVPETKGEVGCALFRSAAGFPMDVNQSLSRQRHRAQSGSIECRFPSLEPGTYAVSVTADRNGNGKMDKNFVGIPSEPWGVSNNARPKMRPPKFAEAAFEVTAGGTRIEIRLNP